jgi:hypothetical protein
MYKIKRVNYKGIETYNKTFPTYRKMWNALIRVQEGSSKSSIITIYENDIPLDTFTGLV